VRVLLVYSLRDGLTPQRPLASLGDIHIGISYVSACLKAGGHSTRLVVLGSETESRSLAALEAAVSEFDPQLVGFTAVSTQFPFVRTAAGRLKQRWPGRFLVLGGVHASLRPEEAAQGAFDAVCIGEGEFPMRELADQLQAGQAPHGIGNLWIKRPDGVVEKNPTREFVPDLDQLPHPDRAMWRDWVMASRMTRQVILPSRGCPYDCSYCSNHALRRLAGGKYVRLRQPAAIVQELRELKAQYPEMEDVYLQSETIAVNPKWLEELAGAVGGFNAGLERKLAFACNFRVARQFLKDEVFAALERANVRTIEIGLESGSEKVREQVLRRNYSNADFYEAVALARRHGMGVNVYNMIGLPGETLADYWETVEVNRRVCPDRSLTSIFFPYPGTDLFGRCQAAGLLNAAGDLTAERWHATLDLPGFPRRQVQRAFDWFEYRVYKGHRPLHFRLRKVVRNKIGAGRWSHLVFMRLLPIWYAVRGRK
jgi:anaerobic magnesium-protoporphyrin IX monomethyl ester cyclase